MPKKSSFQLAALYCLDPREYPLNTRQMKHICTKLNALHSKLKFYEQELRNAREEQRIIIASHADQRLWKACQDVIDHRNRMHQYDSNLSCYSELRAAHEACRSLFCKHGESDHES